MRGKGTLLGSGAIYLISTILIKGIVFLTMPIFTELMTVEDFGIYNAYMSYEAVFSIIMTIGTAVVIRSAWIEYKDKFEVFEKSMNNVLFLLFGCICFVVLGIEILTDGMVSRTMGLNSELLVCLLFHSSGYGLVITMTEKYRMEFKAIKVLLLSLSITISSIFVSLFLISFVNQKYVGRIWGAAFPYLIFWICYFIRYFFSKQKADKKIYKYVLALGIPAIPYILSENIMLQSDRVMIECIKGAYEAGIYSAIGTVASILMIVGNAIDSVWAPWSYKKINEGKLNEIKKISTYYYVVYSLISIGFAMLAPELTRIFTSKEDYWNYTWLIYPMIIMQFIYFSNKIPANLLLYYKKTKFSATAITITALLNIVLNFIAFKKFGFVAAVFTSLICMSTFSALQFFLCRRFEINLFYSSKLIFVTVLTVVVILLEYYFMTNILGRYAIGCIGVVFTSRICLKEIIKMKKKEKH